MGVAIYLALSFVSLLFAASGIAALRLYQSNQRLRRELERLGSDSRSVDSVPITHGAVGDGLLRPRRSEFRALAENSPDIIVRFDRACRRIYVNPTAMRILGLRSKDLIGKTVDEVSIVSDARAIAQALQQVLDTGQDIRCEMPFRDTAGKTRYADIRLVAEQDVDGAVVGVLAVSRDITERKQMEQELEARARELRALADSSPGMMGSFHMRTDGSFCMPYVSPNIVDLFGLRPQDVAKDASCLLMLNHPDDKQMVEESIAASAQSMNTWHCEYRIQHPSKGERWMEGHTMPEPHPDGGIVWHGYVHDITARKLTQKRLELLERAVNLSTDAIFLVDMQFRFCYVNSAACASLGYSEAELLNMKSFDINPDLQPDTLLRDSGVDLEIRSMRFETRHRTREGHVFPVEVHSTVFPIDDQHMFLCVVRDITEHKAMEAAQEAARVEAQRLQEREASLAQAQRITEARGVFLARVSHELRTPLNGMLGYAQILLKDPNLGERQIEGLSIIEQSGEHLLSLVNEILDHAMLESNKLALHIGEIPMEAFLHTVCGIVRIKARRKNLVFICEPAADLPRVVYGDAQRLRQVLLNLLDNAIKCTDDGGVVLHVRCTAPGRIGFSVRDSGTGIDASQHEAIFQTYEQFGDESRRAGGVGLGLSISRQLVRLMGGNITVESTPGEGSTFSFEVDLQAVPTHGAHAPLSKLAAHGTSEPDASMPAAALLPPETELMVFLDLAQRGNMRRIVSHASELAESDARYQPFAAQLERLAKEYQSKAILKYIEQALDSLRAQ